MVFVAGVRNIVAGVRVVEFGLNPAARSKNLIQSQCSRVSNVRPRS